MAPFLVLHFSYHTLVTFLMMLSVILLSIPITLLSTLNVIMHLVHGSNNNWLLIYETLWSGGGHDLHISMLEKLNWFRLISLITRYYWCVWMGLVFRKNHFLRCCDWLSFLNWTGAATWSLLLKLPPRKLEPWFEVFFHLRLLCISTNLPFHAMHGICLSCVGWCISLLLGIVTKKRYVLLLVLHLLLFWKPWLIIKMQPA